MIELRWKTVDDDEYSPNAITIKGDFHPSCRERAVLQYREIVDQQDGPTLDGEGYFYMTTTTVWKDVEISDD